MAVRRPSFVATLGRIAVLSLLATTLSFAVTLMASIISLATVSAIRHTTTDMTVAYRVIGVRAVMIAAPLALTIIGIVEFRSYIKARNEARPLKLSAQ